MLNTTMEKVAPINEAVACSLQALIALTRCSQGINLLNHRRVTNQMGGSYLSAFRGRGMDFAEVRNYQPGDDIRLMDWRVTARTGIAHTKFFEEERERPIFLLLDFNPSMYFATQGCFKSVIAARSAALLAWAAINQGDRVGAIVCAGEQHHELRPRARKHGVLPLLKCLAETTQHPPTTSHTDFFSIALQRMRRVSRPGSLIFIISDFYNLTPNAEKHLALLAKDNELIAINIIDPIEKTVLPPATYPISDGEHSALLNTEEKKIRNQYQAYFAEHFQSLEKLFFKLQIPKLELLTSDAVDLKLSFYFSEIRS